MARVAGNVTSFFFFFVMFISTVARSIRFQVKCRKFDGGYSSHLLDALL